MSAGTATFDASKFERLYRYSTSVPKIGYDNAPERGNARDAAERVAAKAGLTFEEAVSRIKDRPSENVGNSRAWEDFKAERWKAHVREHERKQKEAQERAEREQRDREARAAKARRDAERRESEAAVWRKRSPESVVERALAQAARRLGLNPYGKLSHVTAAIESAARNAHPFPETFRQAIVEFEALESAWNKRRGPVPHYQHGGLIALRNDMIVRFVSGRSPTPEDAAARAEWIKSRGTDLPGPSLSAWFGLLADDVMRMATSLDVAKTKLDAERERREFRAARPVKPVKPTNAQKRQAVIDILDGPGADTLTSREVAERAGVHHSTVADIRRERQGHA